MTVFYVKKLYRFSKGYDMQVCRGRFEFNRYNYEER